MSAAPRKIAKPPRPRIVTTREMRRQWSALLAQGEPLIIGSDWRARAIVLPVPTRAVSWGEWPEARRKAMHAALLSALQTLKN